MHNFDNLAMLVSIVKCSQLVNNMLYNEFPARGLSHHDCMIRSTLYYIIISANIVQEKGDRRKKNSGPAPTRDIHSFVELQPHELSVPVANPLSPLALCTVFAVRLLQRFHLLTKKLNNIILL